MQGPLQKKYFRMEEHFRPDETFRYDLLIELSGGMTSFAVIQADNNSLAGLGIFENPLFPVIEEFPWLGKTYRKTRVTVQNNRFTLVPEALYVSDEKESYSKLMLDPQKEKEEIYDDFIDTAGIYSVYAMPDKFLQKLQNVLPGSVVHHIAAVLIRSFLASGYENTSVLLNIRHEAFDILIVSGKELIFCNSFFFQAPEDVVYYLMFVMDQLKLDPEKIKLFFTGNILQDTPLFELISRYIKETGYPAGEPPVNFSTLFDDLPKHQIYSLLNLNICE